MSYVNYDDALRQLLDAGLNIDVTKLNANGSIQRWKTTESRGNDKPGWTRLKEWMSKAGHLYLVGSFGIWHGNEDGYTKLELPRRDDDNAPKLTAEDIAAAKAAQKAAAKAISDERKREAKVAARWAASVWAGCMPAMEHDYLARKGIGQNGTRLLSGVDEKMLSGVDETNQWRLKKSVGALVVPMHDTNGNVCGLQFIFPAGHEFTGKQFWPTGMAMGGTFGMIGPIERNGILLVAEGFATAASLHEATGQSVAYAFSANNLGKAGKELRAKYPQLKLLFCADDDYLTEQKTGANPGVDAAQKAASEIERAAWVRPVFTDAEGFDLRAGKKLTDFNDLVQLSGLPIVLANQINSKLDALKWRDHEPKGAVAAQTGGGEGRCAVSVMSLEEVVERFIFIDDQTGEYVFDTLTKEICKASKMLRLLPAGMRQDNIKLHPLWQRRAVFIDQIGFDPACTDKGVVCNRWNGWPTTPKRGSCEALLGLLRFMFQTELPKKAEELYNFTLRWLAYPIQHPGAKMQSALVFHGPQGTGKSRFFEAVAKIYGDYGIVINQAAIEDKFNSDWSDRKLFVVADEVVAKQDMYHLKNQLKNLITNEWVRINEKNVAAHREKNHMNIVFLSNEKMPIVLENDDRRHMVIWCPPALSSIFYDEVSAEIDAGGIAALHDYLLHLDLGDFKPWTRPPMSAAKASLIGLSVSSDESFLREWQAGYIEGLPFCPIGVSTLYAEYQAYCKREGEPFPRKSKDFLATAERLGWRVDRPDRYTDLNSATTMTWRCVIPSAEDMGAAAGTDYRQKAGQSQTRWLTECYFAVENAILERDRP